MKATKLFIIFSIIICTNTFSQVGGNHAFSSLNLSPTARITALGGNVIAIQDNDFSLIHNNPSLLNSEMDKHMSFSIYRYLPGTGINQGNFSYAKDYKELGVFAIGVQYLNYGFFLGYNEFEQYIETFSASESGLTVYWAKPIDDHFSFGLDLKLLHSELERYSSTGIGLDGGVTYNNPDKLFTAAFVFRNVGTQFKTYSSDNKESIGYDLQLGASKKLEHAPFRFSLVLHHLNKFDLTYKEVYSSTSQSLVVSEDTASSSDFQAFSENAGDFSDKLFRHVILGVELNPSEHFFLRFGYNYQRRQELKIISRTHLAGMSFGIGLKIAKFRFSYGRAQYHLAGATNQFTITTNLADFYKKDM